MENNDIQKLAKLRDYIISCYRDLDGSDSPTSVMKQSDAALLMESIIRSLDDILRPYVNFSE